MKKFLTLAPAIKKIRAGEWEELSILCETSPLSISVVVKCTRKAGSTGTYIADVTATGGRCYFVVTVPAAETFTNLSKVEAWIEQASGAVSSRTTDIRTFIPDVTARKKPTRIGWVNTLGGIDYYTFTGSRSSEAQVERIEYAKDLPANFTAQNRTAAVLGSQHRQEFEVVSDFETEDTFLWLSRILISPDVWIIDNGVLIPIMISSKTAPVENDALFQLKLKYHKSSDIIGQNG